MKLLFVDKDVCVLHSDSLLSSAVSAETLQKSLDLMGQQIKKLEKTLETFPPAQNDKDLFVEKLSISFYLLLLIFFGIDMQH